MFVRAITFMGCVRVEAGAIPNLNFQFQVELKGSKINLRLGHEETREWFGIRKVTTLFVRQGHVLYHGRSTYIVARFERVRARVGRAGHHNRHFLRGTI